MATKKTTTKKAPANKKPAVKSSKTATKRTAKSSSSGSVQHLKLQREKEDFLTFRVNRETIYWAVLGAVVILFTAWIMQLQADIQKIYDDIDADTAASEVVNMSSLKKN